MLKQVLKLKHVLFVSFSEMSEHLPLKDIPTNYEFDEGTNRRREKHPDDVFALVKEYISSTTLRQPPLLVLTAECKQSFLLTTDRF